MHVVILHACYNLSYIFSKIDRNGRFGSPTGTLKTIKKVYDHLTIEESINFYIKVRA